MNNICYLVFQAGRLYLPYSFLLLHTYQVNTNVPGIQNRGMKQKLDLVQARLFNSLDGILLHTEMDLII